MRGGAQVKVGASDKGKTGTVKIEKSSRKLTMAELVAHQKEMIAKETREATAKAITEDKKEETPSAPAQPPVSMTAEQKIEMAKKLFMEAQKLQKSSRPLTENHRRAVNFINVQAEKYREAIAFHKEGKPLSPEHKAAGVLIQQIQKEQGLL